jgi:hypothetical protein
LIDAEKFSILTAGQEMLKQISNGTWGRCHVDGPRHLSTSTSEIVRRIIDILEKPNILGRCPRHAGNRKGLLPLKAVLKCQSFSIPSHGTESAGMPVIDRSRVVTGSMIAVVTVTPWLAGLKSEAR